VITLKKNLLLSECSTVKEAIANSINPVHYCFSHQLNK